MFSLSSLIRLSGRDIFPQVVVMVSVLFLTCCSRTACWALRKASDLVGEVFSFVLKIGGIQAFLIGIAFLSSKIDVKVRFSLSGLLLIIASGCVLYSFNSLPTLQGYPHLIRLEWGLPLLLGPLLFLYVRSMVLPNKSFAQWDTVHFLPFLANLLLLMPFYLKSGESKIRTLDFFTSSVDIGTDIYRFYFFILQVAIFLVGITYSKKSIDLVNGYEERVRKEYSKVEGRSRSWLLQLGWIFLLLFCSLFLYTMIIGFARYTTFDYKALFYLGFAVFSFYLSFKTIKTGPTALIDVKEHKIKTRKNKDSFLVKKELLLKVMEAEKPYLNNDLSATSLAKLVQISRHELSELLNMEFGQNFYDFINEYRVKEFQKRIVLPENDHLTIMAVAIDSGFNSKSSFNSIFKKMTGTTPSNYKTTVKI